MFRAIILTVLLLPTYAIADDSANDSSIYVQCADADSASASADIELCQCEVVEVDYTSPEPLEFKVFCSRDSDGSCVCEVRAVNR